ncbi:MAG TPA: hypothetical protein VJ739_14965 [Gemmataceae bacterium]|nr:hypothetical protein [Gemmataceae bacterium]
MTTTVDLAQGAELSVGGATVGVFLPEAKLRELNAERESLRKEVEELRRQLAALRSERDQYARSLTAVMRDLVPVISPAEAEALIAEAEKDGVDFGEVVRQIEEMMGGEERGESHAG